MKRRWVYFFGQGQADALSDDKHLVGGKGASLADMTRTGLNVPPGFTISAECCAWYYDHDRAWPPDLEAELRAALTRLEQLARRSFGQGETPLLVAVRSGAAQSMPGMMDTVLNVGLHPECVQALARRTGNVRGSWEAYAHFLRMILHTVLAIDRRRLDDYVFTLIREFGCKDEDDLDADQFEKLCTSLTRFAEEQTGRSVPIDPWTQLTSAINAVFESWNSPRAVAYRRDHGIEGLMGTAVNIQMMCPSEVSGVMFTANPIDPSREEILIESAYGLGDAVVLGEVTPDHFVLDKKTCTIRERTISVKNKRTATLAEDGQGQTGARNEASLTDAQVLELAKIGLRVEKYFDAPSDIEWALSQGQLFLLQSRPIKFSGPAKATFDPVEVERVRQQEIAILKQKAEATGTVWSRFNLSEILPEPTPMSWSIVRKFMSGRGGYGEMYRDLGFDPDPALDEEGVYDLICGRPYCNLSREPRIQYRSLPFEHPFAAIKKDPSKALYPQAVFSPRRAGWRFFLGVPLLFVKMILAQGKVQRISKTFAEQFEKQIVPAYLAEVEQAAKEDWSHRSSADLLQLLNHWIQRTLTDFARESLKPTALTALSMGNLEQLLARRLCPPGAKPEKQAAAKLKAQEFLREMIMGVSPTTDADLPAGLRSLQEGRLSREEFLRKFGHRGSDEMELASPRWSEDPASIEALMTRDEGDPSDLAESRIEAAWQRLIEEAKILPAERAKIETELKTLQHFLALREAGKHYLLLGYALIRRLLLQLDFRYHLHGGVFYLTLDELPRLLTAEVGETPEELERHIQQRQHRRELVLHMPIPHVLFSDDLEAIGRPIELGSDKILQGVPLSAGVAEGKALVLEDLNHVDLPNEPFILVCPKTDPAWVPLLRKARALIMETGGVLSHGAIIARNYNRPAVAGIPEVLRRIKTGQRLRVDGSTGKVSLL